MKAIESHRWLQLAIKEHAAVLLYFSTKNCSVCKSLKPNLQQLISNQFGKIKCFSIFSEEHPDIAAEYNVFAAPTIIVFFDGREFIRKSRNVSLVELEKEIDRLYQMQFG